MCVIRFYFVILIPYVFRNIQGYLLASIIFSPCGISSEDFHPYASGGTPKRRAVLADLRRFRNCCPMTGTILK
jgi:hypothetical protein